MLGVFDKLIGCSEHDFPLSQRSETSVVMGRGCFDRIACYVFKIGSARYAGLLDDDPV